MNKASTDKHQLIDKASTDKHSSMYKASIDNTCRWICLTVNYPLIATCQCQDKMTENQQVQSGADMAAGVRVC